MWFSRSNPEPAAPFFLWTSAEHSVGVAAFDAEHKVLAGLMSRMHAVLVQDHDRVLATRLMEELIAEARAHFAHEERVLEEIGFPGLAAHAEEHAALLQDARGLQRQFLAGGLSVLVFPSFLKNWLIPHMQQSDRTYAAALRRHGVR
jgi:hemerythrin